MPFACLRSKRLAACAGMLALGLVATAALADDAAKPTDVFMGLEPSAAKGYDIMMNELMTDPVMKVSDIDELWKVWEEEERAVAEKADPDERRRLTFERYGWVKRPGDEKLNLPMDYVVDEQGNMGANCFSCHGGKVAGVTMPGAGNSHVDLTTLSTDVRRLRALQRGQDPAKIKDVVGPFNTPLSIHRGFTNAVIFPAMLAGAADPKMARQFIANPELLLHHDMNPPAWWNFKKKERIYADAFAPKTPRQLMPFARALTASEEKFRSLEPNFVHIYQYIEELEAPKYPYAIDDTLASRGKELFENTCSHCHGTYGEGGEFPNVVVPLEEIGTDPRRFHAVYKHQRESTNKSWLQYFGEHPLTLDSEGYLAQPLDGIWATAPYFHNGAAPTLWDVMNSTRRPKVWKRTEDGFDTKKVGLEVEILDAVPENLNPRQRRMYYDTTHVGNSNAGHTFPDELSDDEKWAVIEYLKTL